MRAPLFCISFAVNGPQIRLVVRAMAAFEKSRSDKNNNAILGLGNFPEPQQDFNMLLSIEDGDPEVKLPADWEGYALQMDAAFGQLTEDERKMLVRITSGCVSFYVLLETLTAHGSQSQNAFKEPKVLKAMQDFLDPDATRLSQYSTPQVQELLSKNRSWIWQRMFCTVSQHFARGSRYMKPGLKMLARITNVWFEDNWDPQWGLLESVRRVRASFSEEHWARFADSPPDTLTVDAKRFIHCVVFDRYEEERDVYIDRNNQCCPLFEKETEAQFQTNAKYKLRAVAGKTSATKECHRLQLTVDHHRYHPVPLCKNDGYLMPVDYDEAMKRIKLDDQGEVETSVSDMQEILRKQYDAQVEKHGSATKYFTSQFASMKTAMDQAKGAVWDKKWPSPLVNAVNYCADPKYHSYKPEHLGFKGVRAKVTLELGLLKLQRKFLEDAGKVFIAKMGVKQRMDETGFALVRKQDTDQKFIASGFLGAYWMGYRLFGNVMIGASPELLLPRDDPEQVLFNGDLISVCDYYHGEIKVQNYIDGSWTVVLEEGEHHWIPWQEQVQAHFPFASVEEQLAMLHEFQQDNPAFTTALLRQASPDLRCKLFMFHLNGNTMVGDTCEKLIKKLTPQRRLVGRSGELLQDQAEEERVEALLKSSIADRVYKPQEGEHVANPATGITRKRAQVVFLFHEIASGRPLGKAKSHRVQQGELPDQMKLYWATADYRPSKVAFCPGCPAHPDPEKNVKKILLPKIMREYELEVSQILMTRKDQTVCEMDEFKEEPMLMQPIPPQPGKRPATAGTAGGTKKSKKDDDKNGGLGTNLGEDIKIGE